jgi:hypothetical protein
MQRFDARMQSFPESLPVHAASPLEARLAGGCGQLSPGFGFDILAPDWQRRLMMRWRKWQFVHGLLANGGTPLGTI